MQNNSCHVSLRMQVSMGQSEDSFVEYPVRMILTKHISFSLCCTSNRRTDRILVLKQSGYKKAQAMSIKNYCFLAWFQWFWPGTHDFSQIK